MDSPGGKKLEINLPKIKRDAVEKAGENERFRLAARKWKSKDFDKLIHSIANEVTAKIDCRECGNCCKVLQPAVNEDEIERLAINKNCDSGEFSEKFLAIAETKDHFVIKTSPCVFLDGKICSIYKDRPASCADYPHLLREDQKFRIRRLLAHYELCPIIYHTIEELKVKIAVETEG